MGIEGIINGYYRTGTSIVWWILQQSNPDKIILYEPHSVGLHNEFRSLRPTADTVNPLHGMPIYKPYFLIPERVRREFLTKAKPKPVYTREDIDDAIQTVEMFHKLEEPIYIQSNQLHPILREFAEYFNCKYIHIVRDPAEVLYSHTGSPSEFRRKLQRLLLIYAPNYMVKRWMNTATYGKFEMRYMLETARKLYNISDGDLLEQFVRAYVNYNYYVLENLDGKRGKIVRFEDLVKDKREFRVFEEIGLRVVEGFIKLDPKRAFKAPVKLREAIMKRLDSDTRRKLEELGYVY